MRHLSLLFVLGCAGLVPAQARPLVLERAADRPSRDRLRARLHAIRLGAVDLEEVGVAKLARYLAAASGNVVNFVVASKAELPAVTLHLRGVRLTKLLAMIQSTTPLRFVYSRSLVKIQRRDEVKEYTSVKIYDLRAAVAPIRRRPAPKLGLGRGEEDQEAGEEEEATGTLSGFTADQLVDAIRNHAAKDSWDRDRVGISHLRGVLWVRQTEQGHAEVRRVLRALGVIPPVRRRARPAAGKPARIRWQPVPTRPRKGAPK